MGKCACRFRIRNNAGDTLGRLVFAFDVCGWDTGNDTSYCTFNYRYTLNNQTDPDTMTFTPISNF
ncbi:MAG: hypothetical protein N2595_09540 [bacterium]|nr:hypothetical protein [bacterium]